MQKVEIFWVDSNFGGNDWIPIHAASKLGVSLCQSTGYIIDEDDDRIVIATSIESQEEYCAGILIIPIVCIVSRK